MYQFNAWPGVKGELLDAYLAIGWYRMGPLVFTTNTVSLDNVNEHAVFWLRYNVPAVRLSKKSTLLNKLNSGFTVHYRQLRLNDELEALFTSYRNSLSFEIGPRLENILGGVEVFDSVVVEVRDKGRLVAAGIIDLGDSSIEGIINIYDPSYKKHSLGRYLILKEYEFCLMNDFTWFYPGYYMPGHKVFSYKLFLDKAATEVYLPADERWISYPQFAGSHFPATQ